MNPKRLRDDESKATIQRMLSAFYANKPPEYDLLNRAQGEYDAYASVVTKYGREGGSVLDFGAGTWRSPATLAREKFSAVTACDFFSEDELSLYRIKTEGLPVTFVRYNGSAIPFDDSSFDVVSSLCVIEHILDVDHILSELDRVLRPGGTFIVMGPNWSGLNNPIRGLLKTLQGERYWHYENVLDAFVGIPRVFLWLFEVICSREPRFLLIHPRTRNGAIHFETGDDDCVHLCHPVSFKRWFSKKSYQLLHCNRGEGHSTPARFFNTLIPSLATTNVIVGRKRL